MKKFVLSNLLTLFIILSPFVLFSQASLIADGATTFCQGGSVKLDAKPTGANYSYQWLKNDTNLNLPVKTSSYTAEISGAYFVVITPGVSPSTSNPVVVRVNPFPIAYIVGTDSVCLNASQPNINFTGVSGIAPYTFTYKINSGANQQISTTSGNSVKLSVPTCIAGIYVYSLYSVSDKNGCSQAQSGNATITVNPLPTATITSTGSATLCSGDSVQLRITNYELGNSYQWELNGNIISGATDSSYAATTTGNYKVVVTQNSCSTTSSPITVTVYSYPTATITPLGPTTFCVGDSVQLRITNYELGNSYQWELNGNIISGATDSSYAATTTGNYKVEVLQNSTGCAAISDSVVVTVSISSPSAARTISGKNIVCAGTTGKYTVPSISYALGYSWTLPEGATIYSGNNTNDIIVSFSDSAKSGNITVFGTNGCGSGQTSPTFAVTIEPSPSANVGTDKTICSGTPASIGAIGVVGDSYSWSSKPVGFASDSANPTVSPTVTTTYTLTETITATGCQKTNSVVITVYPLPSANVGTGKTICPDTPAYIGAIAVVGDSYSWSSNPAGFASDSANPTVRPTETTTYTLTETITTTGCQNTDSVIITVYPLPSANVGTGKTICSGTPASIGAIGVVGDSYSWSSKPVGFASDSANPTVSPTVTTTYTLTETITATGCQKTNSVIINVEPLPRASMVSTGSITFCAGDSVQLRITNYESGNSYQWELNGNIISGATDSTYLAKPEGNYTVIVTNGNGCDSISKPVQVTVNPIPQLKLTGDSSNVCSNSYRTEYTDAGTGNRFTWDVINGDIMTGQYTNSILVHWLKGGTYDTVILTESFWETGCSARRIVPVIINENNTAPDTIAIIRKTTNSEVLICISKFNYMEWGHEAKWTIDNGKWTMGNEIVNETCNNEQYCEFPGLDTTRYYYWVKVSNNSDGSCATKSYFVNPPVILGVQSSEFVVRSINLYPNPNSGKFSLMFKVSGLKFNIDIYDNTGKVVSSNKYQVSRQGGQIYSIDVSGLAEGFYFVDVRGEGGFRVVKKMSVIK